MAVPAARVVVQKYGGSSVADIERIHQVARQIALSRQAGVQVVAVVSAMGKTTDQLMKLAHEVTAAPDRRELDMLLSAGERIAMALLAMAVRAQGYPATSLTGSQCGILTNDSAGNARIVEVRPFRVQDALDQGQVVIVAGFQGTSWRREVTTLGRGGSDTTAVALAAALGADCEIYSDVDGIYTADPRVVAGAVRIDTLTHDETLALARAGAKVLAADAVALARLYGIALYARRTGGGGGETAVRRDAPADRPWILAVAARADVAVAEFPADATVSAQVDAALATAQITPIAAVDAAWSLRVVARDVADAVDPAFGRAVGAAAAAVERAGGSLRRGALASVVGPAVGREATLWSDFRAVVAASSGADPIALFAHGATLSALVAPERVDDTVRALHGRFIAGIG